MNVVERYLDALTRHDWDALENTLEPTVVRVGPFGDTYDGRDAYVSFLAELMPTLVDYSMDVHRVVDAGDVVVAELTEAMTWNGERVVTPEALVFDIGDEGHTRRIRRIRIYLQRP